MSSVCVPLMSTKSHDSAVFPASPPQTGHALPPIQFRPLLPSGSSSIADWTRTSDNYRILPPPMQEGFPGRAFRLPSFSMPGEDQLSPPFSDSPSSSSERGRSPDMPEGMPGGMFARDASLHIDERYRPHHEELGAAGSSRYTSASHGGYMSREAIPAAGAPATTEASANRRQRVLMEPKQTSALLELWHRVRGAEVPFPATPLTKLATDLLPIHCRA